MDPHAPATDGHVHDIADQFRPTEDSVGKPKLLLMGMRRYVNSWIFFNHLTP